MFRPAGSPEGSIYNKGGGHTTDILFQRSEVLLSSIYSLLMGLEIIQSTSHFGPPQPVPGLHPGWQNPLGSLQYWAPSRTPHLETRPCALLCWRPGGIREMRCHKGMPETRHTHFTSNTGSLMEQATHRCACPCGTTCAHSVIDGCHQPVYLEGLRTETGGIPEDTNHLSTMLVIEEKGQLPEGLLENGRTETRL